MAKPKTIPRVYTTNDIIVETYASGVHSVIYCGEYTWYGEFWDKNFKQWYTETDANMIAAQLKLTGNLPK